MKSRDKRIVVSVITDLVTDQRVHKICTFLQQNGYKVTLIGRSFKNSLPIDHRIYKTERIYCYSTKGVAQYVEFNLKLFLKLFFKNTDVFLSNDLDTLLPNYLHAFIRGKRLIYDSHEYFTGTPELQEKPLKKKAWQLLEKFLLPKIKIAYTVNNSIADLYSKEYGIKMKVIRNLPMFSPFKEKVSESPLLPQDRFILLLQGAGINNDRGADELIESMCLLPATFLLILIGSGNAWDRLKSKTESMHLTDKVWFIDKVPFSQLAFYTRQAQLGLSLDKSLCKNYELSLPNKIFDYLHAGVPVLASNVKEVKNVIEHYEVGLCIDDISPKGIAKAVLWIYENQAVYNKWKLNTKRAAEDLNWENETRVLKEIYK